LIQWRLTPTSHSSLTCRIYRIYKNIRPPMLQAPCGLFLPPVLLTPLKQKELTMTDARVDAIRKNDKVGLGSCTSIDECLSDADLIQELDAENITAAKDAVKWAIEDEGLRIENALNYRSGEDSDPELKIYEDWNRS